MRTPTEEIWPGVSQLPDYKATFPVWNTYSLKSDKRNLCKDGLDLLEQMLAYDPAQRISAKEALLHPYFTDLNKETLPAKPGQFDVNSS